MPTKKTSKSTATKKAGNILSKMFKSPAKCSSAGSTVATQKHHPVKPGSGKYPKVHKAAGTLASNDCKIPAKRRK